MSVSFTASNLNQSIDIEEMFEYNFSNSNAVELLRHLDIDPCDEFGICGSILSRRLRLKIEAFLEKDEPARREMQVNGRVIECADTRGHHDRARKLLELCDKAGDLATIYWA